MPLKPVISKKVVPDFWHGKIFTVIGEYFIPLKLRYFFTHNISNQSTEVL